MREEDGSLFRPGQVDMVLGTETRDVPRTMSTWPDRGGTCHASKPNQMADSAVLEDPCGALPGVWTTNLPRIMSHIYRLT